MALAAAEVAPLAGWSEQQLLDAITRTPDALLLALDGVQDPHNLGACLRTAAAAGVEAVVIMDGRRPHAMLLELFTEHGAGTLVRAG